MDNKDLNEGKYKIFVIKLKSTLIAMGSWWTPVGWVPHHSVATFMDRRLCLALALLELAVTVCFFIVVFLYVGLKDKLWICNDDRKARLFSMRVSL